MRDLVFIQHVGCFLSSPVWVIYLSGIVSVAFRHICSLPDNKLFVFCLSVWKGAFHLAGQPHFSFSHSYSRIPISTFFRIPVLQSFLCILFLCLAFCLFQKLLILHDKTAVCPFSDHTCFIKNCNGKCELSPVNFCELCLALYFHADRRR